MNWNLASDSNMFERPTKSPSDLTSPTPERRSAFQRGLEWVWGGRTSPKEVSPEETALLDEMSEKGFSREAIDRAHAIVNYKPGIPNPTKLTMLEKIIGLRAVEAVSTCLFANIEDYETTKAAVERYETFSIEEHYYDAEPVLYLNFPGWGLGDQPRDADNDTILAAMPKGGVTVNITSPGSITGVHPDQCIKSNERVFSELQKIIARYPNYKIRGCMQSAGTQYTWIMNRW
jgi:hypothetical protein